MEWQRSLSPSLSLPLKSTLLLTFFSLIASSFLIFFSFSFWIFTSTPTLIVHQTHIHFNSTPTTPLTVQTLPSPVDPAARTNWSSKDSILIDALFEERGNDSGSVEWTVIEQVPEEEEGEQEEQEEQEEDDGDVVQERKMADAVTAANDTVPVEIRKKEEGEEEEDDGDVGQERMADAVTASNDTVPVGIRKKEEGEEEEDDGDVMQERMADAVTAANDTVLVGIRKKEEEEDGGDSVQERMADDAVTAANDTVPVEIRKKVVKEPGRCDLMNGSWVYNEGYPLYTNSTCPYIDEGFNCDGNGRKDKSYMKLRWRPHGCEMQR